MESIRENIRESIRENIRESTRENIRESTMENMDSGTPPKPFVVSSGRLELQIARQEEETG